MMRELCAENPERFLAAALICVASFIATAVRRPSWSNSKIAFSFGWATATTALTMYPWHGCCS